jgi:competence protein ComEC
VRAAAFIACVLAIAASDSGAQEGRVLISEVMADPTAVRDDRGEWIRLRNTTGEPVSLRGWQLASGGDRGVTIGSIVVRANGVVLIARDGRRAVNGGIAAAWGWGRGLTLGNGADWLALRDPRGATVDSVAWGTTRPGVSWSPHADAAASRSAPARRPAMRVAPRAATDSTVLIVRVLDVGQGDATLISNGGSTVLIDGGPGQERLGTLLDSLELNDTTIDVVVLSHQHADHYSGLRELFRSSRRITVRFFFENQDPSPNVGLRGLRDSILARAGRGELQYRDTDDPCGDGRALCTITMRGGAKLHLMRPLPTGDANDRSAVVKLVGPDSASFTMWLAGDGERAAIDWYRHAGYDRVPGMRVDILKANHHGSCNGVASSYLEATNPVAVTMSLDADNAYGHPHEQAMTTYRRHGAAWYRTDMNGTIELRTSATRGGGYSVSVVRGTKNERGRSERRSALAGCNPMP